MWASGPSTGACPQAPEQAPAGPAPVFCLSPAEESNRRENGGVSWAENHSVGAEGRFPNLPSLLTFFWAQRSPRTQVAQNWHKLPPCCQAQALAIWSSPRFLVQSRRVDDHSPTEMLSTCGARSGRAPSPLAVTRDTLLPLSERGDAAGQILFILS